MANLNNLQGTYNINGNYLIHTTENLKLLLTSRLNISTKKTVKFLLDKTDKKGSYISSLYPVLDHTNIESYNFDFQGIRYTLAQSKEDNKAVITILKITE